MPVLLAAKRLTASDLTFFEPLFRTQNAGNQKAINLNTDILIGQLYPDLETVASRSGGEIRFPLTIYGPGAADAYRLTRKIIKNKTYKNWRLNGEFVFDPQDEPGRFDVMRPNDIAVFGFAGRPAPEAVTMVLLAANQPPDAGLHVFLDALIPPRPRSMTALAADQLLAALHQPTTPPEHPLNVLVVDEAVAQALEDAAQGGIKGARTLQKRRPNRPVTGAEMEQARRNMEQTGAEGESLVAAFLDRLWNGGGRFEHKWVSAANAIAPYDFRCVSTGGNMGDHSFKIDVKTTRGPFNGDFHLSLGEAIEAASSAEPYHIWRVYDLDDSGAKLRRSGDIRQFAKNLVAAHDSAMPGGVQADSFSVRIDTPGLTWSDPVRLDHFDPDEEDVPPLLPSSLLSPP